MENERRFFLEDSVGLSWLSVALYTKKGKVLASLIFTRDSSLFNIHAVFVLYLITYL